MRELFIMRVEILGHLIYAVSVFQCQIMQQLNHFMPHQPCKLSQKK